MQESNPRSLSWAVTLVTLESGREIDFLKRFAVIIVRCCPGEKILSTAPGCPLNIQTAVIDMAVVEPQVQTVPFLSVTR